MRVVTLLLLLQLPLVSAIDETTAHSDATVLKEKSVLIFYSGTRNLYKDFKHHIANTECYAKQHGYTVEKHHNFSKFQSEQDFPNSINGFYWKVGNLIDMLDDPQYIDRYDYIVYLDHDAGIPYNSSVSIHELVSAVEQTLGNQRCDVIFQDMAGSVVNAGMFIVRPSPVAKQFVHQWWKGFADINLVHAWQQEQGIAQNTMLHFIGKSLNETYNDECLNIALNIYDDIMKNKIPRSNVASPGGKAAQACFERIMTDQYKLPPLRRHGGHVCLPSCLNEHPVRFTARGKGCATNKYTTDRNWDPNDLIVHSKSHRQAAVQYFKSLNASC
jgi:hypothetical protein